ncbi:hypothetical protein GCM10007242_32710 [Pigmentiphaga litoralis]|uniref:Bug family tripartite tricarboxylate transporter substrate binding protein n=1 Tax=Pigmentiphaga litoralis TaxID=516702 RepID=UPI001673C6DB|nr:tripartite tricarboxylate transporter substrate binding protein [Pigmentiphaga litoralis]GGX22824.1 hypothetical protein GCM10007242_32710 [Pigmentiphaga litoralis]
MGRVWKLCLISLWMFCSVGAQAADFPTHGLRFVVPFSPGTGMDRIARLVGEDLTAKWGQPVVVENRLGAAGHIGAQTVAQSAADGYTVLVTASNISITATLLRSPSFDAMNDLAPLLIAGYGDSTLVVSSKARFNSLADVLQYARANPGKLTFATPGTGSPMHIQMALFEQVAGVKFLHIPYKGTAPAITDLIGGQVDMMFVATHTVMPYVTAGQLKAIAVAAPKRNPLTPNIPSFADEGVNDISTEAWYGFMVPAKTPPDVARKLYEGIAAALHKPAIKGDLQKFGLNVKPSTQDEMRQIVRAEYERYAAVIKQNNIAAE